MRGFGNIRPFGIFIYIGILLLFFNLTITNIQALKGGSEGTSGTLPLETDNYWYIDKETQIKSKLDFFDGNIVINSTGRVIIDNNGELNLENVNIGFNSSGVGIPTIHVLAGGILRIKNLTSRITYSNESKLIYKLVIDMNGFLQMDDCYWEMGNNESEKSGLIIRSSKIIIRNSSFGNGYSGLLFQNTGNLSITNCSFYANTYGCLLINTSNIEFENCTFRENYIKDIQLMNSHLAVINLNLSYSPITNGFELDNKSKLDIYWYLNLILTDKSDKPVSSVEVVIVDNYDSEVFIGGTNETGQLTLIKLLQQSASFNSSLNYNPFKIKASKGKEDYAGTFYIELTQYNSSKNHTLKLKKEDKDGEGGIEDSLMLFCICGMTIITVFLILMSINVYLARKKVGLDKYSTIGGAKKDQRVYGSKSELITCSECGTQVTDDATFCPHCGDYFEGEEVFCPGCGARISDKAITCPKCGRIFEDGSRVNLKEGKKETDPKNSEIANKKAKGKKNGYFSTKTEKSEQLLCSECGAVIDINDTMCPGCGSIFKGHTKNRTEKVARKITSTEEKEKVRENQDKKRKTGAERSLEIEDEDEIGDESDLEYFEGDLDKKDAYMCSICGAGVSSKTKVCPKCGTELE
jgi:rubrerythrin